MSQHYFTTAMPDGRPVQILAGWDRPLQGHFLVVERLGADGDEGGPLYSNLDDEQLDPWNGLPDSMDYFVAKLAELGLQLPPAMLHEILSDAANNVGNCVMDHTPVGQS